MADSLPPAEVSSAVINYLKSRIQQLTLENEELKVRLRMQISANLTSSSRSAAAEKFISHFSELVNKQQTIIDKLDSLSQKLINEKQQTTNKNKKRKTIISNDS